MLWSWCHEEVCGERLPTDGAMSRRREVPLSEWARKVGVSQRTAQRQAQRGELPVPFRVDADGRYMVIVDAEEFTTAMTPEEMTEMLFALKNQLNRIERKLAGR